MTPRRVLDLIPWMLRLSMDGSLWAAIALLAVFGIPFVAIRFATDWAC